MSKSGGRWGGKRFPGERLWHSIKGERFADYFQWVIVWIFIEHIDFVGQTIYVFI